MTTDFDALAERVAVVKHLRNKAEVQKYCASLCSEENAPTAAAYMRDYKRLLEAAIAIENGAHRV